MEWCGNGITQARVTPEMAAAAQASFRDDLRHVAFALVLGCATFWSFDERAKRLVRLEGLQTN